jgi:hypothetical protein
MTQQFDQINEYQIIQDKRQEGVIPAVMLPAHSHSCVL